MVDSKIKQTRTHTQYNTIKLCNLVHSTKTIQSTFYCSCHSKDPAIAVFPTKVPRLGAKMVIFRFGISMFILSVER